VMKHPCTRDSLPIEKLVYTLVTFAFFLPKGAKNKKELLILSDFQRRVHASTCWCGMSLDDSLLQDILGMDGYVCTSMLSIPQEGLTGLREKLPKERAQDRHLRA
jgi:hypothetical protein